MKRTRAQHTLTVFEETSQMIAGIERAEKMYRQALGGPQVDWDDPEDVSLHYRQRRQSSREFRLDKYVPHRVCPKCQAKKLGNKAWIDWKPAIECMKQNLLRARRNDRSATLLADRFLEIKKSIATAGRVVWPIVCRSCWAAAKKSITEGTAGMEIDLDKIGTEVVVKRYKIDGMVLAAARMSLDMSTISFSRKAGWSSAWQSRIENELPDVSEDTYLTILQVLKEAIANSVTPL